MTESKFQADLIKDIRKIYPESKILKNNPNHLQGFPDLTILCFDTYALLEVKDDEDSNRQPNQEYYIDWANRSGAFGAFVHPSNKREVLSGLQQAFESHR